MTRRYKASLLLVGALCLLAAVIHGAWLWYLPGYAELDSLDKRQLNTMLLFDAAITLFLFATGVATLFAARAQDLSLRSIRGFTLVLVGFWIGRFLLQLVMPLEIPLVFIHRPGVFVTAFIGAPVVILLVPLVMDFRESSRRKRSDAARTKSARVGSGDVDSQGGRG